MIEVLNRIEQIQEQKQRSLVGKERTMKNKKWII